MILLIAVFAFLYVALAFFFGTALLALHLDYCKDEGERPHTPTIVLAYAAWPLLITLVLVGVLAAMVAPLWDDFKELRERYKE